MKNGIEKTYYGDGKLLKIEFYLNDKKHREDGPADITYHKDGSIISEEFFLNNKLHRTDGPAIMWYDKSGVVRGEAFFLNGMECDILQEMVIRGLENIN